MAIGTVWSSYIAYGQGVALMFLQGLPKAVQARALELMNVDIGEPDELTFGLAYKTVSSIIRIEGRGREISSMDQDPVKAQSLCEDYKTMTLRAFPVNYPYSFLKAAPAPAIPAFPSVPAAPAVSSFPAFRGSPIEIEKRRYN